MSEWTDEDLRLLREWYETRAGAPLELDSLAIQLGRLKTGICRKARALGLTNQCRTTVEKINGLLPCQRRKRKYESMDAFHAALPEIRRQWLRENDHPRGALGMKHTDEAKARMAESTRQWHTTITPGQREEMRVKRNATNIERYGTAAPVMVTGNGPYSRANGGKREDLDNRYFRSSWEANYARYLRWLKEQGQIMEWEYEPQTFVFHGVTRGALTYTPDFRITENDGSQCWHEIKGWMDSVSKTKLKRFAKYYPDEKVIIIGEDEYKALSKWASLIPGWEKGKRAC